MYRIITSLYRTHIRKTEISISNSLIKKRFKSICVCCSPRPACSQSQPSFLTVVWKTFKLDATFVSDLHSGSEKNRLILYHIFGVVYWPYHLGLFSSPSISSSFIESSINPRYERFHDTSQGTAKEIDELILMPVRLFISWRRWKYSLFASEMTEWTGDPVD